VDGHVANNTIEVHLQDPAAASKVIDVAAKLGANLIGGIEPSAQNEQNARSEALKQATVRAKSDAEAMAAALGMRVVRVFSVEALPSTSPAPAYIGGPHMMAKMHVALPTPVEAGTQEIRVQVAVTLEVAP
jgi:uncharacterized protein YggE